MTILAEIFADKCAEVTAQKRRVPLVELLRQVDKARPPLDFTAALKQKKGRPPDNGDGRDESSMPALIAEVKKGSPSQGAMVADFDPIRLARTYAANGAAAISVLTDEKYFGGSLEQLRKIAALRLGVPLLRKEFICDPYQIYEARAAGADAVLLITACLSDHELRVFQGQSRKLGMAALVEVHTHPELARALRCGATLIGINNRDLRDFSVRLDTTLRLRPLIPPHVTVISESGISKREEVRGLCVDAVLVGEAIVRAEDVAAKVRELSGSRQ